MLLGIPVIAAVAYALVALLPTLARFQERHGRTIHAAGRALFLALWGAYLYDGLKDGSDGPARVGRGAAGNGRANSIGNSSVHEDRTIAAVTTDGRRPSGRDVSRQRADDGRVADRRLGPDGGWVLGVVAEVETLQRAPKVAHTG